MTCSYWLETAVFFKDVKIKSIPYFLPSSCPKQDLQESVHFNLQDRPFTQPLFSKSCYRGLGRIMIFAL
jgi:hypothetical protein